MSWVLPITLVVLALVFGALVLRLAVMIYKGVFALIRSAPAGRKSPVEMQAEINGELDCISRLSPAEAEAEVRRRMADSGQVVVEPWDGEPAPTLRELLDKLDPRTSAFLAQHRRVSFAASFASYSIEHALVHRPRTDLWVVDDGNREALSRVCLKAGSPTAYEVAGDGAIVEEYPSLFHLMLVCDLDQGGGGVVP